MWAHGSKHGDGGYVNVWMDSYFSASGKAVPTVS